jgi:uncharacterized protein
MWKRRPRRDKRVIRQPTVTDIAERKRYEINIDGESAGLALYVDAGNQRIFYQTKIDDQFDGRSLRDTLFAAALADTRAIGKRVVALCPYVAAYVDRGEDFDDILEPVTPQAHAAVRAELG